MNGPSRLVSPVVSLVVVFAALGAQACAGGTGRSTATIDDASTSDVTADSGPALVPDVPVTETPAVCGDGICATGESCTTCPNDCGKCPACNAAPSCSDGLSLPSAPGSVSFDELSFPASKGDAGVPDGGFPSTANCNDAQLRLRVSHLSVEHQGKEVWLPTGTLDGPAQTYYCIMQATDGAVVSGGDAGTGGTVEVALTKPTAAIADHTGVDFGPADSIFWGQTGPRLTQGNLTITYSCFQQKAPGSDSFSSVLNAAAMAAGSLAGAGPYGWAFGVGDVALATAAAAVSAAESAGDWHMFDVTQTIDSSWLLPLTNGATWSFTKSGGDASFQYPWSLTLTVEAWGCATVRPDGAK